MLNSFIVAIIGFALAVLFTFINQHQTLTGESISLLRMGFVVGGSLFIGMSLSGVLGTLIPIMLTKVNVNADNASGPILTTLNDIIALFTYYGIAALLLLV